MKSINWFGIAIVALFAILFTGIICAFVEYTRSKEKPLEPHEGYQRTIEYVGFDGKKHQAIVIHTTQHNWVLVEKK